MALNFPGPYVVKIFYHKDDQPYVQSLNVSLTSTPTGGTLFSAISAHTRGGGTIALDQAVDDWVDILKPFLLAADSGVDSAELWSVAPLSFDMTFISAYAIAEAGTGTGGGSKWNQNIWTFRTFDGGIMKINIMGNVGSQGPTLYPVDYPTAVSNLAAHILSGDNVWIARDDSFPLSSIAFHPGQNERLFKSINR